jgi:hypothetical protein
VKMRCDAAGSRIQFPRRFWTGGDTQQIIGGEGVVVVLKCLRRANVQRFRPSYATTAGTELAAWGTSSHA